MRALWVPSHSTVHDNDIVDQEARLAATTGVRRLPPAPHYPWTTVRSMIRSALVHSWLQKWHYLDSVDAHSSVAQHRMYNPIPQWFTGLRAHLPSQLWAQRTLFQLRVHRCLALDALAGVGDTSGMDAHCVCGRVPSLAHTSLAAGCAQA